MDAIPQKLTWQKSAQDDVVVLDGVLDETCNQTLKDLAIGLGPQATFELGGLRRINSLGARAWIEVVRGLAFSSSTRGVPPHLRPVGSRCARSPSAAASAPHLGRASRIPLLFPARVRADAALGRLVSDHNSCEIV